MTFPPSTLERAFELARTGECLNLSEIRQRLKRERHDQVDAHLQGHAISRQLRALCEEARKTRSEPASPA